MKRLFFLVLTLLLLLDVCVSLKAHDLRLDVQTKSDLIQRERFLPGQDWGFVHCKPGVDPPGCIVDSGKQDFILTFTPNVSYIPEEHHTRFFYHFPRDYRDRVIFLFHGHNEHSTDWFKQIEMSNFTNYVVALGFAVVILDSDNNRNLEGVFSRTAVSNNPDYLNVVYILDYLKKQELINLSHRTLYFAAGLLTLYLLVKPY